MMWIVTNRKNDYHKKCGSYRGLSCYYCEDSAYDNSLKGLTFKSASEAISFMISREVKMGIDDIIQEYYHTGITDGLKVLRDSILMYKEKTGLYPSMEYLVSQMIPDLIENMPNILKTKTDNIRLN